MPPVLIATVFYLQWRVRNPLLPTLPAPPPSDSQSKRGKATFCAQTHRFPAGIERLGSSSITALSADVPHCPEAATSAVTMATD